MRKRVEHRLGDAVGGELAIAGEERLARKGEGPGHRALDGDAGAGGELHGARRRRDDARAIERTFAVGVRRVGRTRAGGAAFGVRFAEDDRHAVEFGEFADDGEAGLDRPELVRQSHPDMAVDQFGPPLGVEADEVELRPHLAGGMVPAADGMLEEGAEECRRRRRRRSADMRAAHPRLGDRPSGSPRRRRRAAGRSRRPCRASRGRRARSRLPTASRGPAPCRSGPTRRAAHASIRSPQRA